MWEAVESLDYASTHGVLYARQLTGKIRVTIEGWGGVWGIANLVCIES